MRPALLPADVETFRVQDAHLALLRRLYAGWGGDPPPWGAPAVNQKRPLGGGDPVTDVIRILGWEVPAGRDDAARASATALWAEMAVALQILCCHAGRAVETGLYRRHDTDRRAWSRVGD